MKPFTCLLVVGVALPLSAHARKSNTEQMLTLDPATRLEQRCNARGMGMVGREHKGFHPDELVAYAFSDPAAKGSVIAARGAAVRSGGKWYHLSYVCEIKDDSLEIKNFQYSLGGEIPRSEWDDHYLVAP